mgnify:CR=1 FL=1
MHIFNLSELSKITIRYFCLVNIFLLKITIAQPLFEIKNQKLNEESFSQAYFMFGESFENYDSYSNQFEKFFGSKYGGAQDKRNFQDLSISLDSRDIRNLYKQMLSEMTEKRPNKKNHMNSFYDKSI